MPLFVGRWVAERVPAAPRVAHVGLYVVSALVCGVPVCVSGGVGHVSAGAPRPKEGERDDRCVLSLYFTNNGNGNKVQTRYISGAVIAVLTGQRRLQLCRDMRQPFPKIDHVDRVDRRVVQQPHVSIGVGLAGCARSTGAFALAANELVDRARLRIPHDGGSPTIRMFPN